MLRESSTPAASNGAAVIAFPEPQEDIIETVTGLPLVDCDPKVIARRLRRNKWKARASFFNNIICDSIKNATILAEHAPTKDAGGEFVKWGMIEMKRRIGEVLDLWGETEPANQDAAVLFFLSLKPAHRHAASMFLSTRKPKLQATPDEQWAFINGYMQKHWQNLAVFYRMTIAGTPCERAAWLAGSQECPEDWFDLPKLPAAAIGAADGDSDDAA